MNIRAAAYHLAEGAWNYLPSASTTLQCMSALAVRVSAIALTALKALAIAGVLAIGIGLCVRWYRSPCATPKPDEQPTEPRHIVRYSNEIARDSLDTGPIFNLLRRDEMYSIFAKCTLQSLGRLKQTSSGMNQLCDYDRLIGLKAFQNSRVRQEVCTIQIRPQMICRTNRFAESLIRIGLESISIELGLEKIDQIFENHFTMMLTRLRIWEEKKGLISADLGPNYLLARRFIDLYLWRAVILVPHGKFLQALDLDLEAKAHTDFHLLHQFKECAGIMQDARNSVNATGLLLFFLRVMVDLYADALSIGQEVTSLLPPLKLAPGPQARLKGFLKNFAKSEVLWVKNPVLDDVRAVGKSPILIQALIAEHFLDCIVARTKVKYIECVRKLEAKIEAHGGIASQDLCKEFDDQLTASNTSNIYARMQLMLMTR